MIRSTGDVPLLTWPAGPDEFPNHTRLLTVVWTMQQSFGAAPWNLLNEVMERIGGDAALEGARGNVRLAVSALAHDLHQCGLLRPTSKGETVTARGQAWIEDYQPYFDAFGTAARAGLLDLGFALKDPPAPEQPAGPLSEERLEAIRSRWQGIGLVTEGLPQGVRAKADVDRLLAEVDRLRTAATTVQIG